MNSDLMPLNETVRGLLNALDDSTFSGLDDGTNGRVRFIYCTDTITQ